MVKNQQFSAFTCNLCGKESGSSANVHREGATCTNCGSNMRFRALINELSRRVLGSPTYLNRFPINKSIKGAGLSDAPHYAGQLASCFSYTNYFYHQRPFLDITDIKNFAPESLDFLISSDVFEHIPPPRRTAFTNSFHLLKPGGILAFTVPYTLLPKTVEHFPNLNEYHIINYKGRKVLVNITSSEDIEIFDNLIWHGGEGSTLEMRVFCEADLINLLETEGFTEIEIFNNDIPEFCIWQKDQGGSFVITAKKPEKHSAKKILINDDEFVYPAGETISHPLIKHPHRVNDIDAHKIKRLVFYGRTKSFMGKIIKKLKVG